MRIGIIGAGNVGSTLARHFVKAGDEVALASAHGPESLGDLVAALGGHVRAVTPAEAADFGEVVVVAVPFGRYRELPADQLAGKTVIDTCNYYPQRDGQIAELDEDRATSSELLQRHLPGAHVVKAFNAMSSDHLRDYGHSSGAAMRYGIPVAGDHSAAKRQVFDLIEQIGFEPVDAGGLADGGRKHQPGADVYGADLPAEQLRERIGVGAS